MSIIKKQIWDFLIKNGLTKEGAAGLMGNLLAESNLNPQNMEDYYQSKLGYNDYTYTEAVDNGTYSNFINDSVGYGLAQWTWYSRKQELLNYAKQTSRSIGNLNMQLEFLIYELKNKYTKSVYNILISSNDIKQSSNTVLLNYECPLDSSESVQNTRYNYSKNIYEEMLSYQDGGILMVKTYKKGSRTQLSTNFVSKEFDCQGGSCCSETHIDDQLVIYLQKIRDHFGRSIIITSGYRCPTHNRAVGGATGSYHVQGKAADISVQGIAPREVAKYAESIGIKGIGLYETSADGYFVHIDTRSSKSFWYGQAQQYRSTFGGVPVQEEEDSSNNTNNSNDSELNNSHVSSKTYSLQMPYFQYGDSGEDVRVFQNLLIMNGYDLGEGGADGIFGNDTLNALKSYQRSQKIGSDGVGGANTMKKLLKL